MHTREIPAQGGDIWRYGCYIIIFQWVSLGFDAFCPGIYVLCSGGFSITLSMPKHRSSKKNLLPLLEERYTNRDESPL